MTRRTLVAGAAAAGAGLVGGGKAVAGTPGARPHRAAAGHPPSYPHYPDFSPDERAIGVGVRAMAGWLAERTHRAA
ncbi:hypothetical protein ABT001_05320 [Streptomyces sp. NPDC002793]|uniref:hypothetical protein n=1 Tax=Streptomyces sp. NPDC002793 TaxID=3154432 RepID=UPI003325C668